MQEAALALSNMSRMVIAINELKKTTGGLTRDDLVKNKRGKLVSRRKSKQAAEQNNLGDWLRNKGDKFVEEPKKPKKTKAKPTVVKSTRKKAEISVTNIVPKRKRKKVSYKAFY